MVDFCSPLIEFSEHNLCFMVFCVTSYNLTGRTFRILFIHITNYDLNFVAGNFPEIVDVTIIEITKR